VIRARRVEADLGAPAERSTSTFSSSTVLRAVDSAYRWDRMESAVAVEVASCREWIAEPVFERRAGGTWECLDSAVSDLADKSRTARRPRSVPVISAAIIGRAVTRPDAADHAVTD
jgi:hypothetical protein